MQPVPPQCARPLETETLGERCETLLYEIITPPYTSPYMTPHTSKQMPPQPFVIPNWSQWWAQYQNKSLEEIQQEARKRIDEFWLHNSRASVVWGEK
jgi:hypothetical protein